MPLSNHLVLGMHKNHKCTIAFQKGMATRVADHIRESALDSGSWGVASSSKHRLDDYKFFKKKVR
jgi:hypothetical protein